MDSSIEKKLADKLRDLCPEKEIRVMEVCGTHTMEFFKTGVRDIMPDGLVLVDGPGCPVCVTPNDYLDRAIEIGRVHGPIITTFGDLIKVPSSYSSLGKELAEGMDVRVVYSPADALRIAAENPRKEVIFLSVGFETTAPAEAATVLDAQKKGFHNFSILPGNKLTPPAVRALLASDQVRIDGFILPGHVSAVIGSDTWKFITDEFGKPAVVAGFGAPDLLMGTILLSEMILKKKKGIINTYKKAVRSEGNPRAVEIMDRVFLKTGSHWRGIGIIPESGLGLREEYETYDAVKKFPVTPPEPREAPGCRCGELLRGLITPDECPLYGKTCRPENPIGPCMVSTEGPCAAYYRYWSGNR